MLYSLYFLIDFIRFSYFFFFFSFFVVVFFFFFFFYVFFFFFFFFQAEDGIRDADVTGVQTWLFRSAVKAYNKEYADYVGKSKKKPLSKAEIAQYGEIDLYTISVDAASSGNPGIMEYRGVDTQTHKQLFYQGPFRQGTNNVGEFLALVHGLASVKKYNSDRNIYSDSKIAIDLVKRH